MPHVPTMTPARQAREAAGISLETAAKRAGVKPSYLQSIERQGFAPFVLGSRLSRIYNCSLNCFIKTRKGGTTGGANLSDKLAKTRQAAPHTRPDTHSHAGIDTLSERGL